MNHRKEWNNLLRIVVVILGSIVSLLSILLSFYIKFLGDVPARNFAAFEASFIWIMLGFIVINILFGTYIFYNKTYLDLFYFTMLSQLFQSFFMMALTYAGSWLTFPRSVLLVNLFVGGILLYFYNGVAYWLYHKISGRKRILVVGEEEKVLQAVINFDHMSNRRHEVTHVVLSNYFQNVVELAEEVDIIYLTGYIEETERLKIYDFLMKTNKKLFLSTNFANLMMVNPNIMSFEDESIIEVSSFGIPFEQAILKRSIDILVSLVMLITLSPIMLVTAILVRLDSSGPIFYRQERISKDQRPFNILKFRSMTQTAEEESGPVLSTSNDSRVTRVGRFIRSTRIDELPQLINVLKGDMSLVGPRPERPFFVNQFISENAYYSLRHHVRAGITGYAQVYGKYATDFNSKLNFDLLYIKNYSLAFDFKLLFQTLKILFDKVSARGVEETETGLLGWDDYKDRLTIVGQNKSIV
ncbi:sugar transferase [Facklamia sp. DSM 111018]|uniref:Sugar transferase n=1 Tax=Facklamia lactis TaxID=2749967 RepID=A0ABS0LSH3_9LACT|nr:sugar transferase [Facklamia lactis]MBG9981435.1 sugar transferase [Facklamia lactis]MBG9987089.1 sugar transferase [Facklamia lactis]